MDWISKNRHDALAKTAIHKLCFLHCYDPAVFIIEQLELFLSLLPDDDTFPKLEFSSKHRVNALLAEAASRGCEKVVRLAGQEGADINTLDVATTAMLNIPQFRVAISQALSCSSRRELM